MSEEKKESGKKEKTFPLKKLPSLMRKKYARKSLGKLLGKVYIEDDRKFVEAFFTDTVVKGKKELLRIPPETEFRKAEFERLKSIAKDIKKNKMRVKLVPLVACASLVAAVTITVGAFKNVIARKAIKSGCEAVFGAKTDVGSVRVRLLGISVRVDSLAIGDKDSENFMKNLFEAENITLDMNFTQALRGKAIINDVSVSGMKFGTDRKTSCELPKKKKKAEKPAEESAFAKAVKARTEQAISDLKSQATGMLGGESAEEIVANIQSKLRTPDAAKKAQDDAQALVAKWQAKPAELKGQVEDFSASVKELQSLSVQKLKSDPTKLKEYLEKINSAITTGNSMKSSFETVTGDVKKDARAAEATLKNVADAVQSDTELAKGIIGSVTDTIKNAKTLLTNALNTVAYDMLGKYYPYVKKGIDYGMQMKAKSDAEPKKEKKADKGKTGRMKGRTIWYSKELPKLWIKNVSASGYTENDGSKGFSGAIQNVTSDQDIIGKPTTAEAKFDVKDVNHSGKITLDVRKSAADLLALDYTGSGFSANVDGAKIASASGIPSINGTATVSLHGAGGADGFSAGGSVSLNPVKLTTDGFSNETVTKYYRQALDSITNLNVGYGFSWRESSGVNLDLSGNFAEQFAKAMETAVKGMASDAKEAAFKKINEQINGSSNEAVAKVKEFLGIEGEIDAQNASLDAVRASLEKKKAELEEQIKGAAKATVEKAKADATKKAEAEGKKALNKLFKK